jgi:hypothetical protein
MSFGMRWRMRSDLVLPLVAGKIGFDISNDINHHHCLLIVSKWAAVVTGVLHRRLQTAVHCPSSRVCRLNSRIQLLLCTGLTRQ